MKSTNTAVSSLVFALAALLTMLLGPSDAFADKLYLKDGRVLDGTVTKHDAAFIIFVEMADGKEDQVHYLAADEVLRVVIDNAPPQPVTAPTSSPPPVAKAAGKKQLPTPTAPGITGRPQRVAVMDFGPPRSWQGTIGGMVGQEIAADAWRRAIPMLEKDKVDVVVVRVNSGGGYLFELSKFQEVFENAYKPRFRTVAWIESAISCAAMSPWVLEEFYMLPEGNIGACTAWAGQLVALQGPELEAVLRDMEEASRKARRDSRIMRAMQIPEPLSYNKDDNGNVTWFQDLSGKKIANPAGQILTFTADEAVACNLARAKAATLDELVKAMGIPEYELAGKEASKFIDDNLRQNAKTAKDLPELDTKYNLALEAARALRGPQNRNQRMQEIGIARATLAQMKQWMSGNPNFYRTTGHTEAWFEEQERILKELARS